MSAPILATKLYIPPPRPGAVPRPGLLERLNEGLRQDQGFARKLTLISAPAGFGKTALVSAWVAGFEQIEPKLGVAWLSLEEADRDLTRFLAYLISALQTIAADLGAGVLVLLQAPQPPPTEVTLTALLNEIAALPAAFVLVLDDYHLVDSQQVDQAVAFLVEHLPPQMHLAIATREDPPLPLARLRGRGQLAELRAAELRFTPAEAAEFLNRVMRLNLSPQDITALEDRTEGWIAGLQMAALALQGAPPTQGLAERTRFIDAFTASHHFVLDYLLEEVLEQQPESIQTFLLRTSILDRMCGPLCEAVTCGGKAMVDRPATGQETLEYLERANLFTFSLDNERRWYRYHHLFGDLLRQRLGQNVTQGEIAELHIWASQWYEHNALEVEAFHHAVAADDLERAERLIQERRMPLHSLVAVTAVLGWLDSLPKTVLDARPWLWVRSAMSELMAGRISGIEEKLQAAEAAMAPVRAGAMQGPDLDDRTRDLIGQIAAIRATLSVLRHRPEAGIIQSRRALDHLHPDNRIFRSRATWSLGFACELQGDRVAARQAYTEAVRLASGNTYHTVLAATCLGRIQESENRLCEAAETYRHSLQLLSDQGPPNATEEYIGLARICYEWNDLDAAEQHGQQSLQQAQQYDPAVDRFMISEVFLARVKLARGDVAGAAALLAEAEQTARQRSFLPRLPEIAAVQVLVHLRQGNIAAAAQLTRQYELPLSQARVFIARHDPSAALALLEPLRRQMETRDWADERLKVIVLQAVALHAHGDKDKALQMLSCALSLAEPGGFIRLFVDEGESMRSLVLDFRCRIEKQSHDWVHPQRAYLDKLLAAFKQSGNMPQPTTPSGVGSSKAALVEPLSQRELEILRLIAEGLSNQEIGARLFLALNTVKGHNRVIFDKLQVERRTEAVARARELGLL